MAQPRARRARRIVPKAPYDPGYLYDCFHINSIHVDSDGNLLVSARNTWTVYKVERNTGEVLWRLGGKKSDFEMGPGTQMAFHHDARRQQGGTIAIFDNGAYPKVRDQSRGIVVKLDEDAMKVALLREYTSRKATRNLPGRHAGAAERSRVHRMGQ